MNKLSGTKRMLSGGVLAAVFLLFSLAATAGDDNARVRAAVQSGEIVPLENVLKVVNRDFPGQVIEVELDSESSGWVYKIKVLGTDGRVSKIRYDAKSLEVLKVKGSRHGPGK